MEGLKWRSFTKKRLDPVTRYISKMVESCLIVDVS